jgi:hypothetical protein
MPGWIDNVAMTGSHEEDEDLDQIAELGSTDRTRDSNSTEQNDSKDDIDPVTTLPSFISEDFLPGEFSGEGHEVVEKSPGFPTISCELKNGHWICQPYKREVLAQQVDSNSPGSGRRTAIIGTLRDMGVKVFIIDSNSVASTKELLRHVKRVIGFVAHENRVLSKTGPLGFQRCLLYQDRQGRVFNLLLAKHSVGPAATWQQYLDSFSGLQAMAALTIISRSFPCVVEGKSDLE